MLLLGIHRCAPCPQILKLKSTVVNRAPLMTAWATVVAERMGFQREEALSIGECHPFPPVEPLTCEPVTCMTDDNSFCLH